jgi:ribosome maturation factor RimP
MKENRIAVLLSPILASLDLELEAIDLIPAGKRRLLRVVVDGDGPNGHGPSLDDIAEATMAISVALDSADVTGSNPYTLEVSSRGIGRPLELPRHWRRNLGRLVAVTTRTGDAVTGRIVASSEESAQLDVEGVRRDVALSDVAKALVQVEMNRTSSDMEED